jgi:pimeloyl-ACP methyl ester carboxylesterase
VTQEIPLILLPGINGDDRLFRYQKARFPKLVVPRWLEPDRRESLSNYAFRLAKVVDPGEACFVGGASFGGPVALEMARYLRTLACFLIGGIDAPDRLPWQLRVFRPMCCLGPEEVGRSAGFLSRYLGPVLPRTISRRLQSYAEPDAEFLRWASLALLAWKPGNPLSSPTYHIHGELDRTLPVRLMKPDVVVRGCGHLVSLRAPDQVNGFLYDRMRFHLAKDVRRRGQT